MPTSLRVFLVLGMVPLLGALSACSGCEGGFGPCPENPCDPGEVCRDGACIRTKGCPGGCLEGQTCEQGQCVWDGAQCQSAGDPCTATGPTNAGFACVPWTGNPNDAECAEVCSGDGECPQGSACVLLQGVTDSACQSEADCGPDRTCSSGTCRVAACRPSECEGLFVGDQTCQQKYGDQTRRFPNGAKCYSIQNGANFCLPAGRKERGETCSSLSSAVQSSRYSETCGRGLACRDGTCVEMCTEDADCAQEESCIGVDASTIQQGVGQCANACEPFSEGACGDGATCKPIGGGDGRCVDAGDREMFSRCTPGQGQCQEGTVCITYQSGDARIGTETIARCHPLCDLSAGERTEDGTLTARAQDARDATCPQPEAARAKYRIVHAESSTGPVDVYRSGASMPIATGLQPGAVLSGTSGSPYRSLDAGSYDFSVLPEGAPETDLPLVEWIHRFGAGESRLFVLTAPASSSESDLRAVGFPTPQEASFDAGNVGLRVAHGLTGTAEVDVVAVPPGEAPGSSPDAVEIAAGLAFGEASDSVGLSTGAYDIYIYPAGADRSTSGTELLRYQELDVQSRATLVLHGTLDPSDAYDATPAYLIDAETVPAANPETPPMTCVVQERGALGYCQQVCTSGPADYGQGVCDGDQMGCQPVLRNDRQRREHLCAPVGDGEVGDVCNTFANYGECKEGNYCLEYGNTREGYQGPTGRGLCHSLCAVSGEGTERLRCPQDQSCKPLNYQGDFSVGQCNFPCESNDQYTDASCPKGLRSCKPVTTLDGPLAGQGSKPPDVEREQAFCSVSGNVEPGNSCRAQNCRPKSECLFPRSRQNDLVRALLSPYVGSSSGAPSCRPRCDPFDGESSTVQCGDGETCLFNYPWSAEVGHCAAIASNREPGSSCENPGLSCGEDSICVNRGGSNVCMRFCEYEGPDVQGDLQQSTCPTGFECNPFVRDIGVCRR